MVWFTDADLLDLAGSRSYHRGEDYVAAVDGIRDLPDGVVAAVAGTGVYRVRLRDTGGVLAGDCSCPYGQEGNFCKHCVAVGLRLLSRKPGGGHDDGFDDDGFDEESGGDGFDEESDGGDEGDQPGPGRFRRGEAEIRAFLTAMDHDDLVDLVWRHARNDPGLYRKVRLMTAAHADTPDLALLRTQVEELEVGWIGHDEDGYTEQAHDVVGTLAGLIPGHAAAVQPLLRRAVTAIGTSVERCETECIGITQAAAEAWQVFLDACEADPPEPAALGRWLARFRLEGPDVPEIKLEEYAGLLGATGLDAYWQILEAANEADPSGYAVRRAREELIAATGNVDAMVACHAEDLSSPYRYLHIARILCEDGRPGQAIAWLERGLEPPAGTPAARWADSRLVNRLAELYAEAGRHADVIALHERHLGMVRSLEAYNALRNAVRNAPADDGVPGWEEVRPRALAVLRAAVGDPSVWGAVANLAHALLSEDEVDQAWRLVNRHHCGPQTMLAVAARRGLTHPDDAVRVYLPVIESEIARTHNSGYETAASLLATLRDLPAIGDTDFPEHLIRLKHVHRRKTNFLAALGRQGL